MELSFSSTLLSVCLFVCFIMLKVVGTHGAFLGVLLWVRWQLDPVGKARASQVANICVYCSNKKHQFPGRQTCPFHHFPHAL